MSNYFNLEEIKKIKVALFSQMPSLFLKDIYCEIQNLDQSEMNINLTT